MLVVDGEAITAITRELWIATKKHVRDEDGLIVSLPEATLGRVRAAALAVVVGLAEGAIRSSDEAQLRGFGMATRKDGG